MFRLATVDTSVFVLAEFSKVTQLSTFEALSDIGNEMLNANSGFT